jgi:hypothetical protein
VLLEGLGKLNKFTSLGLEPHAPELRVFSEKLWRILETKKNNPEEDGWMK